MVSVPLIIMPQKGFCLESKQFHPSMTLGEPIRDGRLQPTIRAGFKIGKDSTVETQEIIPSNVISNDDPGRCTAGPLLDDPHRREWLPIPEHGPGISLGRFGPGVYPNAL